MFWGWNKILGMMCELATRDGMIKSAEGQTWFDVTCNSDNCL